MILFKLAWIKIIYRFINMKCPYSWINSDIQRRKILRFTLNKIVWFIETHAIFYHFIYWLIMKIFISSSCLPKGTKTAMKNRIWNIMMLVFWMQHWAHARLLLFDLANDDEYQEDKNKEGCNWEGRRKKCIPLFVVQTILELIFYITVIIKQKLQITLLKNVTFAFLHKIGY